MGATKDLFIDLRMREDDYKEIPLEYREQMEIKKVDEFKPDYSHDELWTELKKKSTKAYKQLKEREFKLRQDEKE